MTGVPKSAKLIKWHQGTAQRGPHKGKIVVMKMFEGKASKGYQSDYKRVPHRWVYVKIGDYTDTRQFSGRNYNKAQAYYNDGLKVEDSEGNIIVELNTVKE